MNKPELSEVWSDRKDTEDQRPKELRSPADIDSSRVLHSAAFRRLQGKTQVLGLAEGDFHRSRLTHSMEVANVGRGIVQRLQKDSSDWELILPSFDQVEAICFSHDLGHPPFGHNGEVALNACLFDDGGFEGNGQTLRIVSRLESKTERSGLNLTRRTLLGILKYPVERTRLQKPRTQGKLDCRDIKVEDWKPPKCYLDTETDIVKWILLPLSHQDRNLFQEFTPPSAAKNGKPRYKSLDCSIMEIADDIAYGVHDIEDGVALGLLRREHFTEVEEAFRSEWSQAWKLTEFIDTLFQEQGHSKKRDRKWAVGALTHALLSSAKIVENLRFSEPLLRYTAVLEDTPRKLLEKLNEICLNHVIGLQTVQTLEYRGRFMVSSLYEAINSSPEKLMPESFADQCKATDDPKRVILTTSLG